MMSAESSRLKEEVSSFRELEAYVKEFKAARPTSKVVVYLDELRSCLSKEEDQRNIRTTSDRLYNAFPVEKQYAVMHFLKVLVFQQDKKTKMEEKNSKQGDMVADEHQGMTSQTTNKYGLKELELEVKGISPFSILSQFASKVSASLQKGQEDAVKKEAHALEKEIAQKGNKGLSPEGQVFLKHLQTHGCLPEVTGEKKNVTTVNITLSSSDKETAQVHQTSSGKDSNKLTGEKDKGKQAEDMNPPGKAGQPVTGAQSMRVDDKHGQHGKPANFSATLPARTQEPVAGSGEIDRSHEVLRLVKKLPSTAAFDMSEASKSLPMQHPGLEILTNINELKNENKSVAESKDKKIKELEDKGKADKDQIEKLQQDANEVKKVMQETEHSFNKYIQDEQTKYSKLHKAYEDLEREKKEIQSYSEEMQQQASKLAQKLQKSIEKNDKLNADLVQQAEEGARQKYKLSEEVHRLHADNKQLKSRVSELAGAKLMDNNPDIADLSDPNRALKLGERFSCLYDDTWTDIFQLFTEKFKMTEEEAIKMLLQIVMRAYDFCRKVADEQMDCLCNIFETPCQDIPKALTMKPQKPQMTQKQHKELKDLRKKIALNQADAISKQYLNKEYEELKKGDKQQKKMLDEMKIYYEKCAEVCWPMVLHDPPVRMALEAQQGAKIDMNRFRLYGGNGDTLEYIVWPALFVEGGGFVTKGVAKPKKVPRTVKKP